MPTQQSATIEARLSEQKSFPPPESFVEQANMKDPGIYERFENFPDGFVEYAEMLDWDERWDRVLECQRSAFLPVVRGRQAQRLQELH